ALGVVLGGRIGYVLFYEFDKFLENPIWLFQVWTGGMSFHGGFLGVMIAMLFWCKKYQKTLFQTLDFIAPCVQTGLMFGRFGNF
ncbi:prolipoprotein diacylglyceryl transferase family protein, partial [Acinetobacter nosocomialis]|uniref:prolipoprotein diacylglyceryl transferase family protein n=1 Tax=Acinetobacter nosocomialis TaxID=106654 RepID=UPI003AF76F4E